MGAWGLFGSEGMQKKSGLDLIDNLKNIPIFDRENPIKAKQWVMIAAGTVLCLVSTWIDWNGSKVLTEFSRRGPLLFTFQYIYYLFEVALVLLIIIFGQMAFEKWSGNNSFPFGGVLVALTWGGLVTGYPRDRWRPAYIRQQADLYSEAYIF